MAGPVSSLSVVRRSILGDLRTGGHLRALFFFAPRAPPPHVLLNSHDSVTQRLAADCRHVPCVLRGVNEVTMTQRPRRAEAANSWPQAGLCLRRESQTEAFVSSAAVGGGHICAEAALQRWDSKRPWNATE